MQVWFPGDHSDVGGGYPEPETGLSKGALKWMVCEAAKHGLLFDPARVKEMFGLVKSHYIAPDPNGPLHNSLTGFWRLLEFAPKKTFDPTTKTWKYRINLFRRRIIPDGASVHEFRLRARSRLPQNLQEFSKEPADRPDELRSVARNLNVSLQGD